MDSDSMMVRLRDQITKLLAAEANGLADMSGAFMFGQSQKGFIRTLLAWEVRFYLHRSGYNQEVDEPL